MRPRRPLSRVRYDPIIDMWVVSATEHAPPGFQGATAWRSWPEALRVAHRVAGLIARVQRERDEFISRLADQGPPPSRYWQGGPLAGSADGWRNLRAALEAALTPKENES